MFLLRCFRPAHCVDNLETGARQHSNYNGQDKAYTSSNWSSRQQSCSSAPFALLRVILDELVQAERATHVSLPGVPTCTLVIASLHACPCGPAEYARQLRALLYHNPLLAQAIRLQVEAIKLQANVDRLQANAPGARSSANDDQPSGSAQDYSPAQAQFQCRSTLPVALLPGQLSNSLVPCHLEISTQSHPDGPIISLQHKPPSVGQLEASASPLGSPPDGFTAADDGLREQRSRLRHSASSDVSPQHVSSLMAAAVQRAHLMMSETPALLTLISESGKVLVQNEASVNYYGNLEDSSVLMQAEGQECRISALSAMSSRASPTLASVTGLLNGLLSMLFMYSQPQLLQDMLQVVLGDHQDWRGTLRVPRSLHLAHRTLISPEAQHGPHPQPQAPCSPLQDSWQAAQQAAQQAAMPDAGTSRARPPTHSGAESAWVPLETDSLWTGDQTSSPPPRTGSYWSGSAQVLTTSFQALDTNVDPHHTQSTAQAHAAHAADRLPDSPGTAAAASPRALQHSQRPVGLTSQQQEPGSARTSLQHGRTTALAAAAAHASQSRHRGTRHPSLCRSYSSHLQYRVQGGLQPERPGLAEHLAQLSEAVSTESPHPSSAAGKDWLRSAASASLPWRPRPGHGSVPGQPGTDLHSSTAAGSSDIGSHTQLLQLVLGHPAPPVSSSTATQGTMPSSWPPAPPAPGHSLESTLHTFPNLATSPALPSGTRCTSGDAADTAEGWAGSGRASAAHSSNTAGALRPPKVPATHHSSKLLEPMPEPQGPVGDQATMTKAKVCWLPVAKVMTAVPRGDAGSRASSQRSGLSSRANSSDARLVLRSAPSLSVMREALEDVQGSKAHVNGGAEVGRSRTRLSMDLERADTTFNHRGLTHSQPQTQQPRYQSAGQKGPQPAAAGAQTKGQRSTSLTHRSSQLLGGPGYSPPSPGLATLAPSSGLTALTATVLGPEHPRLHALLTSTASFSTSNADRLRRLASQGMFSSISGAGSASREEGAPLSSTKQSDHMAMLPSVRSKLSLVSASKGTSRRPLSLPAGDDPEPARVPWAHWSMDMQEHAEAVQATMPPAWVGSVSPHSSLSFAFASAQLTAHTPFAAKSNSDRQSSLLSHLHRPHIPGSPAELQLELRVSNGNRLVSGSSQDFQQGPQQSRLAADIFCLPEPSFSGPPLHALHPLMTSTTSSVSPSCGEPGALLKEASTEQQAAVYKPVPPDQQLALDKRDTSYSAVPSSLQAPSQAPSRLLQAQISPQQLSQLSQPPEVNSELTAGLGLMRTRIEPVAGSVLPHSTAVGPRPGLASLTPQQSQGGEEGSPAMQSMQPLDMVDGYDECWHELEVKPVVDPVTQERALLLVQRDFTERARLEKTLTELTEAQLSMLSQIFPRHVIEALSMGADIDVDTIARLARSHTDVSILFMDIAGFTAMSKDVPAEEVIIFLNILFSHFDMLVESHGVQKVDTIGDAYLVASGILVHDAQGFRSVNEEPDPEVNAQRLVAFAFDMMRAALPVRMPNGQLVRLRIGIHTGPCVSGLVGMGVPKWSVFGDTVNTAARLEQTCELQKIQISEYTHSLLGGCFAGFTPTGGVHMKGKGVVQTYLWAPPDDWILAAETGQTLSPLSITPQSSLPSPAPHRPASPASATPAFTAGYAGKPTLVLPATILEAPDSCHVNSIILAENTSSSHALSCLAHGDSPSTSLAPVALSANLQAVPPYPPPNLLSSLSSIDPSSDGNLLRPSQVEVSYSSCHAPLQPLLDMTAASHLPQPPLCSGRSFILGPDNQPSSTASTVSGAVPHLAAAEQVDDTSTLSRTSDTSSGPWLRVLIPSTPLLHIDTPGITTSPAPPAVPGVSVPRLHSASAHHCLSGSSWVAPRPTPTSGMFSRLGNFVSAAAAAANAVSSPAHPHSSSGSLPRCRPASSGAIPTDAAKPSSTSGQAAELATARVRRPVGRATSQRLLHVSAVRSGWHHAACAQPRCNEEGGSAEEHISCLLNARDQPAAQGNGASNLAAGGVEVPQNRASFEGPTQSDSITAGSRQQQQQPTLEGVCEEHQQHNATGPQVHQSSEPPDAVEAEMPTSTAKQEAKPPNSITEGLPLPSARSDDRPDTVQTAAAGTSCSGITDVGPATGNASASSARFRSALQPLELNLQHSNGFMLTPVQEEETSPAPLRHAQSADSASVSLCRAANHNSLSLPRSAHCGADHKQSIPPASQQLPCMPPPALPSPSRTQSIPSLTSQASPTISAQGSSQRLYYLPSHTRVGSVAAGQGPTPTLPASQADMQQHLRRSSATFFSLVPRVVRELQRTDSSGASYLRGEGLDAEAQQLRTALLNAAQTQQERQQARSVAEQIPQAPLTLQLLDTMNAPASSQAPPPASPLQPSLSGVWAMINASAVNHHSSVAGIAPAASYQPAASWQQPASNQGSSATAFLSHTDKTLAESGTLPPVPYAVHLNQLAATAVPTHPLDHAQAPIDTATQAQVDAGTFSLQHASTWQSRSPRESHKDNGAAVEQDQNQDSGTPSPSCISPSFAPPGMPLPSSYAAYAEHSLAAAAQEVRQHPRPSLGPPWLSQEIRHRGPRAGRNSSAFVRAAAVGRRLSTAGYLGSGAWAAAGMGATHVSGAHAQHHGMSMVSNINPAAMPGEVLDADAADEPSSWD